MDSEGDEVLSLNDDAEEGSFSGFSSVSDSKQELTASTSVQKIELGLLVKKVQRKCQKRVGGQNGTRGHDEHSPEYDST